MGCALLASTAWGCSDLSEFGTGPGVEYRGQVFGVDTADAGVSFIRRGFEEGTQLRLEFDPDQADSPQAGRIWTDDAACGAPTFDGTWLRAIAPLQHDELSLYDFPGAGRLQNYIYMARPGSGPLAGQDVSVFLSLVRGGDIQVRVISGFGKPSCGPCDCFFGVFDLRKEKVGP